MPFTFPASPTTGVTTSVQNGRSYTYAGNNVWELTPATGGGGSSSSGVVILPGLGDPFYSSVSLLLHGDGDFVDKSSTPKTVTANGGATANGAAKVGSSSFSFSGSSQYLSIPYSSDFDLSTGDFTVECWAKATSLSSTLNMLAINTTSDQYAQAAILITTSGGVYWLAQSNSTNEWISSNVSASGLVTVGTWYHFAGVKSGANYTLYLNGVNVLSYTSSDAVKSKSSPSQIGWRNGASAYFEGQIDEVRVTKAARYNANFAPTALAYPDSANVVAFVESGVPAAPTSLSAAPGNTQASLSWSAPFAAYPITDYVVEFRQGSGSWMPFSDGTSTSTSATVTGLANGTAYTFRVAAVNSAGQGEWSSVSNSATPSTAVAVQYLVVAGGGGGGSNAGGGGGGAGGVLEGTNTFSIGTQVNVVIGSGGVRGTMGDAATNGGNSSFGSVSTVGGGRGGNYQGPSASHYGYYGFAPNSGGSGGGCGRDSGGLLSAAAGTAGQGYAGGVAASANGSSGGGGGGGGGVGADGGSDSYGLAAGLSVGGIGFLSTITGNRVAGGGGGSTAAGSAPAGGAGGGGSGTTGYYNTAASGSASTGGGGGGSCLGDGGNGGGGVVVLRASSAAASTTGSPTVTSSGGYTIYTFTGSGSITF